MKRLLILSAFLLSVGYLNAQTSYQEAPNPVATNPALWTKVTAPQVSWGSTDMRYKKEEPASIARQKKDISLTAWKGEKVSAQLVVWTPEALNNLSFIVSDLTSGSSTISKNDIRAGFVRYVMTDELNKDGKGACGYRNSADYDSTLVADPIDHVTKSLMIPANATQAGWISISVPQQAKAGKYTGTVTVKDGDKVLSELKLAVNVKNRTLPAPSEWAFHLDLWQNPYAEARYYNVEPFSKEHFDRMRPDMQLYADAGGKVITASIMHKPWNGQTYDAFESMVTWLKKADGTWYFDYTVFDKWVEYMMSIGVKKQINCYSMVPWRLSFQYFDQASNTFKYLDAKPGEPAYDQFWETMLKSFAKHLKEKGWFNITHISMDERPMKDMLATLAVIRKADKDFKVSLAGTYHDELVKELDDYCIAIGEKFPTEVIDARREAGQVTTYYTCCTEPRPNTFTFSLPAEAEWLGWFAAKENLDGYLRWALNSWVKDPLQDSRFTAWAAGDTYMIYPEGRSCIRFERLIEGVQAFEKIRILKEEFEQKGNKSAIKQIDKLLKSFDEFSLEKIPATIVVNKAKEAINKY
ncbi:glycoside hydrolase domain-containing protein [Phocaeicola sp.]